jgi:Protein of unknown function (DUF2971)
VTANAKNWSKADRIRQLSIRRKFLKWRVGPHQSGEPHAGLPLIVGINQLGVRHFSRFLRSGPRCCRHEARFRFSAGHFSKARSGAPGIKMQNKLLSEYDKSAVDLAGAALGQISEFHRNRDSVGPRPGSILYHYTAADGLKGIIENNELWATSAYFLNDSAEITYGYGVLKEVLDDWLAKNQRPEESMALGLARHLRRTFGEDLLERRVIRPIYLACFCEDDNLLSQWRAYGQSGGYSLGFMVPPEFGFSGQRLKPEPNIYTPKWARVEYDRKKQTENCRSLLEPIFEILDKPDVAQAIATVAEHPLVGYSKIFRAITDILLEEIVSFKNEAFGVEKEWRVVVRQRELTKQGTDDGGTTPVPVHFRISHGMLVPYVKLIPTDPASKLPIACIRSGPTLDKTTAGMAVSMMLMRNNFSRVVVRGSDISVRFY